MLAIFLSVLFASSKMFLYFFAEYRRSKIENGIPVWVREFLFGTLAYRVF